MKKIGIIGIILFLTIGLFAQQDETRILNLKIVADQGCRKQITSWKGEVINFMTIVSQALDSQVKIRLQITNFENWERTSLQDADDYLIKKELTQTFLRKNSTDFDVIIALTSHHLNDKHNAWCWEKDAYIIVSIKKKITALDKYKDLKSTDYLLLTYAERRILFPNIFLHELGHVFGCDHENDKKFAMYIEGPSMIFSPESIKIIQKNKWREFKSAQ